MINYSITKQVSKMSGKTHYYASPQIVGKSSTKVLGRLIAAKTTATLADVEAVLYALSEVIVSELLNGNEVILDGIGRLYVSLKSRNADSREEFTAKNITDCVVRLDPSEDLDVYTGAEFNFVPTRKEQAIAKAASKAGQSLEASDGDTD